MQAILDNRLKGNEELSPANTAVLAIHWQNDIVLPDGAFGAIFSESVRATGTLARAAELVAQARRLGVRVFHVLAAYEPSYRGHVVNNALFKTVLERRAFIRGTPGFAPCAQISPEGEDVVIEHSRINAFYGTDLSAQLRAAGVSNLAITGVATNVAVDHTVREAVQDGFRTYLLEDCCCSSTPEFHNAAMLTMAALSTHVMTQERFLSLLTASHRHEPH